MRFNLQYILLLSLCCLEEVKAAPTSTSLFNRLSYLPKRSLKPTRVEREIKGRGAAATPTGSGFPMCTLVASYSGTTAKLSIEAPNGTTIGGTDALALKKGTGVCQGSGLPYTICATLGKKGLTFTYSNDAPWTIPEGPTARTAFDCRQFKFWFISAFWPLPDSKSKFKMGTLNWTMQAFDGTILGGEPQHDIFTTDTASYEPPATLLSELSQPMTVDWSLQDNSITFALGDQKLRIVNSTGAYSNIFISSSARSDLFQWTRSGILG